MNDGDFLIFIAAGELTVEEEGWEKNKWADRDVKKQASCVNLWTRL